MHSHFTLFPSTKRGYSERASVEGSPREQRWQLPGGNVLNWRGRWGGDERREAMAATDVYEATAVVIG